MMDGGNSQDGSHATESRVGFRADAPERPDHAEPWTPIDEDRAARVLSVLADEPVASAAETGSVPDVSKNPRRDVAMTVLAVLVVGSFEATRIPAHSRAENASLMGPGMAEGTTFARFGSSARMNQEQDMNKRVMASALAGAMLAGSAEAQSTAVQWRVEDGGNGHWYQRVTSQSGIGWHAASELAVQAGGTLACLETPAENEWTWLTIVNVGPDDPSEFAGWIGLVQTPGSAEPIGGWNWVSGAPLTYQTSMCFDNALGFGEEAFGCYYRTPTYSRACWADNNAGGCWTSDCEKSLIIEWSADCNNDGIVDYGQCLDGSLLDADADNVPDCCEQGIGCTVLGQPVQWRVEDGGNGHWYEVVVVSGGIRWTTAKVAAESRGGTLAMTQGEAEDAFCWSLVSGNDAIWSGVPVDCGHCASIGGPWLGGHQDRTSPEYNEPSGGWRWLDGSAIDMSASRWFEGRPNNGGGDEGFLQYWRRHLPRQMNDNADMQDRANGFIIEWSADCNNDGIVDYGQILQGILPDGNANGIPDTCECSNADITANGMVDGADLGALLAFWGPVGPVLPEADLNRDGTIDGADLGILLSYWGPCGS